MPEAVFRFYGSLNDFFTPKRNPAKQKNVFNGERKSPPEFIRRFKSGDTVKDSIEAIGVVHPEVNLILANNTPVGFSYLLQPNDRIAVYPEFCNIELPSDYTLRPPLEYPPRFIADIHLGRLVKYLRLFGFDILYDPKLDDADLSRISAQQNRVILSRDTLLLKRKEIIYGYRIRATNPREQIREIITRYALKDYAKPMSRCLVCNTSLVELHNPDEIERLVPPCSRPHFDMYFYCKTCDKAYWKGHHYDNMRGILEEGE
jgi:hypothetical protein